MKEKHIKRVDLIFEKTDCREILEKIMKMEPDAICQEVLDSDLKGRGGAGFPTGMKWRFASQEKVGFVAETASELRDALGAAHQVNGFVIIEARVPPDDISPISKRFIRKSIRKSKACSDGLFGSLGLGRISGSAAPSSSAPMPPTR